MQPILTELLNLPGIEVENYTKVADRLILEVEAKTTKARLFWVHGDKHS
jgi:transposase